MAVVEDGCERARACVFGVLWRVLRIEQRYQTATHCGDDRRMGITAGHGFDRNAAEPLGRKWHLLLLARDEEDLSGGGATEEWRFVNCNVNTRKARDNKPNISQRVSGRAVGSRTGVVRAAERMIWRNAELDEER